ncbi:MAG TPA: holo-ACP synthase [Anaerolineaceae bacterium]|nr:holo-ACP synthase [Anaerolineaceae bacterium]HPC05224.1 holo-ACP synthase [Anaerolineaceae bacterium]HQP08477.1 holo-ACP synthase [Anaerolineaceae bacterium]
MLKVYSGIDLVSLNRLDGLKLEIRERFIRRALTVREIEDSGGLPNSILGKIAAKEAVSKALECGISAVGWQSIEILSRENGAPYLVLHASANQAALEKGIFSWSISITHERTHAAAVAIALGGSLDTESPKG